jgi:hypothetical protein
MRLIFKTKPMPRIVCIFMTVLWVTGFCLLAYSTFNIGKQFSSTYKITTSDTLKPDNQSKTLIVRANHSDEHSEFTIGRENSNNHLNIRSRQDIKEFLHEKISENIDLRIIKGIGSTPVIKITRRSAGTDRENASANAKRIDYHYTVKDSIVYLDDFFSMVSQQLWRNQNVVVTIEMPEGYRLFIDPSCNRMFDDSYYINSDFHSDDHEITGKYLRIDGNGIVLPE